MWCCCYGYNTFSVSTRRFMYVYVCMCVCVCVCVCVSLQLILCFCSSLDPTGHHQNLASVYYMTLDTIGNFQMFRWIDNNVVKMVFNIHMGTKDEVVMKQRKKPRIYEFNRKHIRLVWGDDHLVAIKIPTIINDYNHWMLCVELVDQLIVYYRPKFHC